MTAGTSAALSDTAAVIYEAEAEGKGAQSYLIRNSDESNDPALVNVEPLHAADEWFPIRAGKEYPFTARGQRIVKIQAKCAEGKSVTVEGGIMVV